MPHFSKATPRHDSKTETNSDLPHQHTPKAPSIASVRSGDMSSRGGRGGARGGLKGATWEHDPTIKLESAPSELFPVCVLDGVFIHEKDRTNYGRNILISNHKPH